jgi:hypothetical protein
VWFNRHRRYPGLRRVESRGRQQTCPFHLNASNRRVPKVQENRDGRAWFVFANPILFLSFLTRSEQLLSKELDRLAALTSNHLVIYAGSHLPLERRELPPVSEFDSPPDAAAPPSATAVPSSKGGILHNYQLLTPALITSLLVAFFILVPIVMIGINALASIQSTLRSEAPKDYSAQEKKMQ